MRQVAVCALLAVAMMGVTPAQATGELQPKIGHILFGTSVNRTSLAVRHVVSRVRRGQTVWYLAHFTPAPHSRVRLSLDRLGDEEKPEVVHTAQVTMSAPHAKFYANTLKTNNLTMGMYRIVLSAGTIQLAVGDLGVTK